MTNVKPIVKKPKVHKKRSKFFRWQSDNFMRVGPSWRRPRGIDSCFRKQYKGTRAMPTVGYGTDKKTRNILPNGFKKFRVYNVKEVDLLLMHNRRLCAEIARTVSAKSRRAIVERCEQLNVKCINKHARLREEEEE